MDEIVALYAGLRDTQPCQTATEAAECIKTFVSYAKGPTPLMAKNFDHKVAAEKWGNLARVLKVEDCEIIQDSVLQLLPQEAAAFLQVILTPAYTTVQMRHDLGPLRCGIWVDALTSRAEAQRDCSLYDSNAAKLMEEKQNLLACLLNCVE